jgi:hypothetical protein
MSSIEKLLFTAEWRQALRILKHPANNTKKSMDIGDSLRFYYKLSVIPILLTLAVAIIVSCISGSIKYAMLFSAVSLLTVPINLILTSGPLHLVGKLFGKFKKPYDNTFTASVYSIVPSLLISWMTSSVAALLQPGMAYYAVVLSIAVICFIVEAVIWLFAISNLQKITKLTAIGLVLLTIILVFVLLAALVFLFALAVIAPASA